MIRVFFVAFSLLKLNMFFNRFLDRFWVPCWHHFGCQNRPKSGQVRSKMALDAIFFEKRDFSRNLIKTNEKSLFLTPRGDPKRPKNSPRRSQDGLEELLFRCLILSSILVRFGSHFGAILAPFWLPFGTLWGAKLGPNSDSNLKIAPRGPKRRLRGPKRRPGGPKRRPRGTQKAPTGSQEHKKGSQEHQKGTQEHPNGKKCFDVLTYVARFPFLLRQVYLRGLFSFLGGLESLLACSCVALGVLLAFLVVLGAVFDRS